MSNTKLLIRLRDLHEELSVINDDLKSVDLVEEDTIDALGQLVTDVGALVDKAKLASEEGAEAEAEEHIDIIDRIKKFESDHPRVTSFLSQMTDLLAMMGI